MKSRMMTFNNAAAAAQAGAYGFCAYSRNSFALVTDVNVLTSVFVILPIIILSIIGVVDFGRYGQAVS